MSTFVMLVRRIGLAGALRSVVARWSYMLRGLRRGGCLCGEINARHCPRHNETNPL